MNERTREWFLLLSRALFWAAGLVLFLSVIGAVQIATGQNAVPIFEDLEQQGRGALAIAALGGGIAAAGVLAGLGAILRVLLSVPGVGPGIIRALRGPER